MIRNNMEVVQSSRNPIVLVVTPLLPGHKISKITKKTIKRNNTPFVWISSTGPHNIPTNAQKGIDWYRESFGLPPFFLMIDNDIELGRDMIDRMVKTLIDSPPYIAFTYANFKFKGFVNKEFPAVPYNINSLLRDNYISSNSLIRTEALEKVGGLVTDDRYKRLLDWCLWLKFFSHNLYGVPTTNASFIAQSSENDISAGSVEDYKLKKSRVVEDFIKPIFEKAMSAG